MRVKATCGSEESANDLAAIVHGTLGQGGAYGCGHSHPPDDPAGYVTKFRQQQDLPGAVMS